MSYTAEGGMCRKLRRETSEGNERERLKEDVRYDEPEKKKRRGIRNLESAGRDIQAVDKE